MATVRFSIRHPEDERPQSIYVSFRFGRNEKLMYATPIKVEAIFWDKEKERVKVSRYCTYCDNVNSALLSLSSKLEEYITSAAGEGQAVTKERLRLFLDRHFGKEKGTVNTFHDFFSAYTEECDRRMNGRRGGQNITYKTKREYVRTHDYIRQYERENKKHLNFEDIDQEFLTSFAGFLQRLNLATNTIAHKTITIKAVMRAAVERGLTENTRWQFYHNVTEDAEAIALNEEELERIRKCNLKRHPTYAKVRDMFLMECWTGLRFSDVVRLRPEHIQGEQIVIRQQKTDNLVTIPIHPVFREVWERYGGVPLTISNQKYNDYIKKVCMAARINDSVLKSITKGGKKRTTRYKKWQLVSSHTGRRSFATNLYKSGFPSISIMAITGHKTEAAFLKYIKVSRDEHAKLLAEHWKSITAK